MDVTLNTAHAAPQSLPPHVQLIQMGMANAAARVLMFGSSWFGRGMENIFHSVQNRERLALRKRRECPSSTTSHNIPKTRQCLAKRWWALADQNPLAR
jgi:hypothetical protein